LDDDDRTMFLTGLAEAGERFAVDVLAYVLMGNHYHLLLRTRRANLSKAMQWLGVSYTTRFNFKQSRSGHLFQGRLRACWLKTMPICCSCRITSIKSSSNLWPLILAFSKAPRFINLPTPVRSIIPLAYRALRQEYNHLISVPSG
jgi:hypothetical protein